MQTEEGYQPVFFDPRPLKNLLLIDEMESLSPIMDLKARASCHVRLHPHRGGGQPYPMLVWGINMAMRSPAPMLESCAATVSG